MSFKSPSSDHLRRAARYAWRWYAALLALLAVSFSLVLNPSGSAVARVPVATATSMPFPVYLPFVARQPVAMPSGMGPSDFGLVWVNSAEELRSTARIRRGVATGAQLDRFPLYWNEMEPGPGQYQWAGQDAALAANESQGLGTLAILLGLPAAYYPSGATQAAAMPQVGGSFLRQAAPAAGRTAAPGTAFLPPDNAGFSAMPEAPPTNPVLPQTPTACSGGGPPAPRGLGETVFGDATDVPGPGKTINPANPWANFVYRTVDRYRPGGTAGLHVRYWEIWNEPDLCQFWTGTAQQYARLVKVAFLAARQADPSAYIVWGGLAHYEQPNFLYDLIAALHNDPMAAQFGGFFDAAAGHHYAIEWNGYLWTAQERDALDAAGWSAKPIWITESGVPVCNDTPGPSCPSPWRASPEEQASYIWQNVAYTRLAGGGPIFQFNLHDDCGNVVAPGSPDGFGLVKNEATSYCSPAHAEARLSYTTFTLANRYFSGTELLWADIQPATAPRARRFAFYDPALHERRTLVFALDADVTASLPATGSSARRIAIDGSETALAPVAGQYQVALKAPTNLNWPNGQSGYNAGIYGVPYILIEQDTLPPAGSIDPLPATSSASFPVTWRVTDLGSGLLSSALYYQVDDGPWELWWSGGPPAGSLTSANGVMTFDGQAGHHYRFGATGTDRAGNTGQPVTLAETWTTTNPPRVNVTGDVTNVYGGPAVAALVAIADATSVVDSSGHFGMTVPPGSWDVLAGGRIDIHGQQFSADTALSLLLRPAAGADAVTNGDFEAGLSSWQESGSCPLNPELQPDSQDHALRLATGFVPNPGVPGEDGYAGGNSTLSQPIHLPEGHPYLAMRYRVDSAESAPGHDWFEVLIVRNSQATTLLKQQTGIAWQTLSRDLSAFAGSDVTLILNVYQSSPYRPTSALVDLVTVGGQ